MAFTSYITYIEYKELGGKLSEEAFPNAERKAQRYLDSFTFNRIQYLTSIPDVVKEVLVEFIDRSDSYGNQSLDGDIISSYSNGIEKLEYKRSTEAEFKKELYDLAIDWLPDYLVARSVSFNVEEYIQPEDNNP